MYSLFECGCNLSGFVRVADDRRLRLRREQLADVQVADTTQIVNGYRVDAL